MPWLLLLHIATLLCWCGALLYLPGLMLTRQRGQGLLAPPATDPLMLSMPRFCYTLIVTPMALAAIISGTLVFLVYGVTDLWLLAKLGLVSLLTVMHLFCGWLVLRAEQQPGRYFIGGCRFALIGTALLITAIFWLVLAKPMQGG